MPNLRIIPRLIMIGIIFPILIQFVFLIMYTSNYPAKVYSLNGFEERYNTSVYKTRLLGRELHIWTYNQITPFLDKIILGNDTDKTARFRHIDPEFDYTFYLTYLVISTVFLCLTSIILILTLELPIYHKINISYKNLIILFILSIIGLTEFVLTPYDTISYFFFSTGAFKTLKEVCYNKSIYYWATCLIIALATLNRETSFLIISFSAVIYLSKYNVSKVFLKKLIIPILAFAIVYFYLKTMIDQNHNFTDTNLIKVNFTLNNKYSIAGLGFSFFILYFMIYGFTPGNSKLSKLFLVFSIPYLLLIPTVGLVIEFRLWIPLLIGSIILALIDTDSLEI